MSKSLTAEGHFAISLQRQKNDQDSPVWDLENCLKDIAWVGGIFAVVHLAGANTADGRCSKTKKNRILNSRVKGTKLLAEYFAKSNQKPWVIISASAVGFYGDRGAEIVDEDSKAGKGFMANVCVQWEDALKVDAKAGIRLIKVRFGTVLNKEGGALKRYCCRLNWCSAVFSVAGSNI